MSSDQNITIEILNYKDVNSHFKNHPNQRIRERIRDTLKLFEQNGLIMIYIKTRSQNSLDENIINFKRQIDIVNGENFDEENFNAREVIANFSIRGSYSKTSSTKDYFDSGRTIDMELGSEETFNTISLRNIQISRIMFGELLIKCLNEYQVRKNQLVFIDSDASAGFWDSIGMIPNTDDDREEGSGYEKEIEFGNIFEWVFNKSMPRRSSRISSRRYNGSTSEIASYKRKGGRNKRKTTKIKNNTKHKKNNTKNHKKRKF